LKGFWKLEGAEMTRQLGWSSLRRDTSKKHLETWQRQQDSVRSMLKRTRVDVLEVTPHENYVDRLVAFFQRRRRGRARIVGV